MGELQGKVVSPAEWVAARRELLRKEKELTRLRDDLSRERRKLPWEKVEKKYVFEGPQGKQMLADLFGSRNQLMIYHFMLGPGWPEGCPSCSFIADHFDGMTLHLEARDITLMAVSHATLSEIEVFKKRMGWRFKWVSSNGTDFNYDFQVSAMPGTKKDEAVLYNYEMQTFPSDERPGLSVFYKDDSGDLFHTYSTYARGLDILLGAYNFIDMTPKGRNEDGHGMGWVRHHDKYGETGLVHLS